MFFRDTDAGVAEEDGDLVDGDAGEQHLNREGIAEHMAMGALGCAVRLAQIGDREETAVAALPVGDEGSGVSIPAPEKIAWIRLQAIWHLPQQLGDFRRQRHIR